jgi:hypothetical protein
MAIRVPVWEFCRSSGLRLPPCFKMCELLAHMKERGKRRNPALRAGTSCAVTFGREIFRGRESGKLLALQTNHLAHVTPPR